MYGAAAYGFFLAVAMLMLDGFLVTASTWLVFWLVLAVQLATAAVITWRRTGLPLAAASTMLASVISTVFAVAAVRGIVHEELLRTYPLETIAVFLLLVFLFMEGYRRHRARWARWREHHQHCSFRDYLMFRHIPDLRSAR
jgi:hypothetical protein